MSRQNDAVDDGWLCDYGRYNYDYINADNRLTAPLVRRNGQLQPVTWDEALEAVADGFKTIALKHGPEAVGGLIAPTLTNEELYLFQKLLRLGLGTSNVDYRLDGAGYVAPFDYDAGAMSIAALDSAGAILAIDLDPIHETPVIDLRLKKAITNRVPLIAINANETDLTRRARLWLRHKPGTTLLVLAGILKALWDGNKAVEGFQPAQPLAEMLVEIDLDQIAQASGVPASHIERAATLYAAAGPRRGAILYRRDDTALPGGGELLSALRALAMMTGSSGEEGLGLHGLVRHANEQGALDMGVLPTHLPGHVPLESSEARAALADAWGGAV
jgi:predicted molibdopterin-dependent oxidoreductase YjgC